jgi:hypothetical protein
MRYICNQRTFCTSFKNKFVKIIHNFHVKNVGYGLDLETESYLIRNRSGTIIANPNASWPKIPDPTRSGSTTLVRRNVKVMLNVEMYSDNRYQL